MTPSADQVATELTRVLLSPELRGSEPLRNLLRFLAQHSLDDGGTAAREHDIALAVFARHDFDPKIDSVVRVQTGRLRSKLAEYYMGEGSQSEIVLEIPKGSYGLSAHLRAQPVQPVAAVLPVAKPSSRRAIWVAVAVVLAAILTVVGFLLAPGRETALETFWKPLIRHTDDAVLSFSNPRFVGQSITGLKLYEPGQPEPAWINRPDSSEVEAHK